MLIVAIFILLNVKLYIMTMLYDFKPVLQNYYLINEQLCKFEVSDDYQQRHRGREYKYFYQFKSMPRVMGEP